MSEECKKLRTDLDLHKALLKKTTDERDLFKARLEKLENEFKVLYDKILPLQSACTGDAQDSGSACIYMICNTLIHR